MNNSEEMNTDTENLKNKDENIVNKPDIEENKDMVNQVQPNNEQVSPQNKQIFTQNSNIPPQNQQIPPFNQQNNQGQAQQFVKQMGSQVESFAKNKELLEKVGLICACAGFVISFIFTFISCSKSASNSVSLKNMSKLESLSKLSGGGNFRGSYFFIVVMIGMVLAIAGGVMAFMSKQREDFSTKAKLTFLVVIVTMVFAIIPNVTICAYNNSLNNATEEVIEDMLKDYSSMWD